MAGRKRHRTPTVVGGKQRRLVGFDRIKRAEQRHVDVDWAQVEALRQPEVEKGNLLKPNGACHDCGRTVSGERRFCGPCLARHERKP